MIEKLRLRNDQVPFEASLPMADMAKRVHVTLPDTVHADLEAWADLRDQKIATVAAIAIEMYLESLKARGEMPTATTEADTAK